MQNSAKCPWCDSPLVTKSGAYEGPHGKVVEKRCSKCGNLVSTRQKGITENIIKKNIGG